MIIYPAIDLHRGNCVRLQQGVLQAQEIFSSDPVETARRWAAEGAEWLHVVNLDGAFALNGQANRQALEQILTNVTVPVQFGGGLRSMSDIQAALDLGVSRVVLGTAALTQPEIVKQALRAWSSERIAVGIDARGGQVATQGWTSTSSTGIYEFAALLKTAGIKRIIYTDIERDGMLRGLNLESTSRLADESGLQVIASGGVAGMADIRALVQLKNPNIEGVIIGMALYRGLIKLPEALRVVQGDENAG